MIKYEIYGTSAIQYKMTLSPNEAPAELGLRIWKIKDISLLLAGVTVAKGK